MGLNLDSLVSASFPLRKGPRGYFAVDSGFDALPGVLEQVLGTIPGERVNRPSFGCDIHKHLFAPADEAEAGVAQADIEQAVRLWVPWIKLEGGVRGVEATISGHVVSYTIRFRGAGGGSVQTLAGEIQLQER